MQEGLRQNPANKPERRPKISEDDIVDDVAGKPILIQEIKLNKKKSETVEANREQRPVRERVQEDIARLEEDIAELIEEKTPESTSVLLGVKARMSRMFDRVSSFFGKKEREQTIETKEAVEEPTQEELAEARKLMVELPEQPTMEEIRQAFVQLVDQVPELQSHAAFSEKSALMKTFLKPYMSAQHAWADGESLSAIIGEEEFAKKYPAKKQVFKQAQELAQALSVLNDHRTKRGQMLNKQELAHALLKDYTINRFEYEGKRRKEEGGAEEKPKYGEVSFTEKEREAFRQKNPEIVALHEKIAAEPPMEVDKEDLLEELPDSAIEPLEEEQPPEPKRLSVKEKHSEVTVRPLENPRSTAIERTRTEIARLRKEIEGKQQRLVNELQWWRFGESNRIARKATKEAVAKLEKQMKQKQWALSGLLNADKMVTQDELDKAAEHTKEQTAADRAQELIEREKQRSA